MTTAAGYVPDRGDVVRLEFTPQAGHEQAGTRPALVLTPAGYNSKTGLMLCCPVTNQAKGYPFEIAIATGPGSQAVTGVALADQIRCFDWIARRAVKIGSIAPHLAFAWLIQACDQPQQSGLPAAGRAHHRNKAAGLNREIQRTQGVYRLVPVAEDFRYPRKLDGGASPDLGWLRCGLPDGQIPQAHSTKPGAYISSG